MSAGPLPLAPLTPTDPGRIPAEQRASVDALAAISSPLFPTNGHGHNHGGPATQALLGAADQATFDSQWAQAVAAAQQLDTVAKANAAGYVVASTNAAGVGVHFVKWSLIDKPFDPTAPSMLLFDLRRDPPVLVGFSYWIHSTDAPVGFAGDNDHWHQHSGLCIVNGWSPRERGGPVVVCGRVPRWQRPLDAPRVGRPRLREPLGRVRRHEPTAVPAGRVDGRHRGMPGGAVGAI